MVFAAGKDHDYSKTRLTLGDYIADVLISKNDTLCSYYTLQRIGSAEVIELGRFDDFEEAKSAAKEALKRWHSRDRQKTG